MTRSTFLRVFSIAILNALFLMQSSSQSAKETGLQSLAKLREFYVGAAISIDPFRNDNEYQETFKNEFNVCVAENEFKFSSLQPEKGVYMFEDADAIANFALAQGMKLRGHTLVWHNQLPKWVTEGKFSREEAIALMKEHIDIVVRRYKGKVWVWDVVNEAVDEDGKLLRKDSFWYKTIGPDYVKLAFQFTREADPDALLYYNDYSAEDMGSKSKAVYNLVRDLKLQGVPINGVGWQMHVDSNFKINSSHRDNAKRLADLGLEVSITELDVRLTLPATQELATRQAGIYRDVTQFCLSIPNCKVLVMWGFTDKYSWIPQFYPGNGDALIFDSNYKSKPAYSSLKQAIQDAVSSTPVITKASIVDNNLFITGNNFNNNAVVFLNWKQIKASADKQNPLGSLIIKKIGKSLGAAGKITLQVQNPGGKLSTEYNLLR